MMGIAPILVHGPRWSLGGLLSVRDCPACGSASREGEGTPCNDPTIKLKAELWSMQKCRNCRSLYLDPRPDNESLALAYRDYETHLDASSEREFEKRNPKLWALALGYLNRCFGLKREGANHLGLYIFRLAFPWRQKLDYYCRHLFSKLFSGDRRLLDVGCGNGAFLVLAKEMGWEVLGIDPDPIGVELCRRKGVPAIQGTLEMLTHEHAGTFNAVTLSHSIEHVGDMREELQRVHELLKPFGMLWLATPNPASLGARLFGRAWRGLRPPYHLCIPSQRALKVMLQDAGFEKIKLIRRGVHSGRPFRESASHVEMLGLPRFRAWFAPVAGILSDILACMFVSFSEETVIVARKPKNE